MRAHLPVILTLFEYIQFLFKPKKQMKLYAFTSYRIMNEILSLDMEGYSLSSPASAYQGGYALTMFNLISSSDIPTPGRSFSGVCFTSFIHSFIQSSSFQVSLNIRRN